MKYSTLVIVTFALFTYTVNEPASSVAAEDSARPHSEHAQAPDPADITLGNGKANQIQLSGITRNGPSLIIPKVIAEADSFLVLHPFADGAPVQMDYVGAILVSAGAQKNVPVRLDDAPSDGTPSSSCCIPM